MKNSQFFKILISFFLAGICYSKPLPELELRKVLNELRVERDRIKAISDDKLQLKSYYQDSPLLRYLEIAQENFNQKSWSAVIGNLNYFLNGSQYVEDYDYLRAQYLLGYSYHELGDYKSAVRAYLRFLASFVTKPDAKKHLELQTILYRLLAIQEKISQKGVASLRSLLSALSSVELEGELRVQLLFMSALLANGGQLSEFGEDWFEQIISLSSDVRTKIQAQFYLGVIYVKKLEYEKAVHFFEKIIEYPDGYSTDYQDLAKINLARIFYKQGKNQKALDYLQTVSQDSVVWKEAIYESFYIEYDRNRFEQAQEFAKILVDRYPGSTEARTLNLLLAQIYLQSGDVNSAKDMISTQFEGLVSLRKSVRADLLNQETISNERLLEALSKIRKVTEPPIGLHKAEQIFSKLSYQKLEVDRIRAELSRLVMNYGELNYDEYKPFWKNHSLLLHKRSQILIDLASKLLHLEREFYDKKISDDLVIKMNAYDQRRQVYSHNWLKVVKGNPNSWLKLTHLNIKCPELFRRISVISSRLNSIYFSSQSSSRDRYEVLLSRSQEIRRLLHRASELIRAQQISDLGEQSIISSYHRFFITNIQLITEQSYLFSEIREADLAPSEQHLASDLIRAWSIWRSNAKILHDSFENFKVQIRDELENDLLAMQSIINTHNSIVSKLESYRQILGRSLAEDMPSHLLSLDTFIENQQARLSKWSGDAEWQRYLSLSNIRKNSQSDFSKSKAKIEEKIRDTEQRNLR